MIGTGLAATPTASGKISPITEIINDILWLGDVTILQPALVAVVMQKR